MHGHKTSIYIYIYIACVTQIRRLVRVFVKRESAQQCEWPSLVKAHICTV